MPRAGETKGLSYAGVESVWQVGTFNPLPFEFARAVEGELP